MGMNLSSLKEQICGISNENNISNENKNNIDNIQMMNMEVLSISLRDLPVLKISSENNTKIIIGGQRYYISKKNPLYINEERKNNPKFNTVCENSKPYGDNKQETINLSKVQWYVNKGSIIILEYGDYFTGIVDRMYLNIN